MRKNFARNESGATAVEFALVSPLIFMSVLGTFETGRALYEQARIASACAAGARAVTLDAADSVIKSAVEGKYKAGEQQDLTVVVTTETISGRSFKKIEVTYDHDLIVKFGHAMSGFTLKATRYAPNI